MKISEAYATVPYGERAELFLQHLFPVVPNGVHRNLFVGPGKNGRLPHPRAKHGVWLGTVFDKRTNRSKMGMYVVPQILDAAAVESWRSGKGVGSGAIAFVCSVTTEIDDVPLDVQIQRLDAFEEATGLRGLVVLSGDPRLELGLEAAQRLHPELEFAVEGKSLHWNQPILPEVPTKEVLALRQRVADAICAILGADPSTRDLPRRMRAGGWVYGERDRFGWRARIQTYLDRGPVQPVALATFVKVVEEYADRLGVDIDAWVEARKTRVKAMSGVVSRGQGDFDVRDFSEIMLRDGSGTLRDLGADLEVGESVALAGVCHDGDRPDSARLSRLESGRLRHHCFRCVHAMYDLRPRGHRAADRQASPALATTDPDGMNRVHVDADDLDEGKYLSVGTVARILRETGASIAVLASPLGAGKTQVAADAARRARTQGCRVTATSPLRTLTAQLGTRLGIDSYADLKGDISTSAVVCAPSLRRVTIPPDGFEWEALGSDDGDKFLEDEHALYIADEVEQTLRQTRTNLGGPTAGRRTYQRMIDLLRHVSEDEGRWALLLDAHAGAMTTRLIEDAGVAEHVVWITTDDPKPRPHVEYSKNDAWLQAVLAHASALEHGEYIGVASQSRTKVQALAKTLERRGIPSLVVSGETALDLDLANLDAMVGDMNKGVVLLTPAACSGVSITTPVQRVYAFVEASVGTMHDLDQLIHRFRCYADPEVHVRGTGHSRPTDEWKFDPEAIIRSWQASEMLAQQKLQAEFPRDIVTLDEDGGWVLNAEADRFVRACALGEALDREHGFGWTYQAYKAWKVLHGAELRAADQEVVCAEVKREIRAAGDAAEDERAARIASATVSPDVLAELEARGPETSHEQDVVERARIEGFYRREVDPELVLADDKGKLRRQVIDVVHTVAASLGSDVEEGVATLDRADMESGDTIRHNHEHRLMRGAARAAFLSRSVGRDGWARVVECFRDACGREMSKETLLHEDPRGRIELTPSACLETLRWAQGSQTRALLKRAGWMPPRADGISEVRAVVGVWRRLGAPIEVERGTLNGRRVRRYFLDLDALRSWVGDYAHAYLDKLGATGAANVLPSKSDDVEEWVRELLCAGPASPVGTPTAGTGRVCP